MATKTKTEAPRCSLCGAECQPTDNGKLRCPVPNHDTYVKDESGAWVKAP